MKAVRFADDLKPLLVPIDSVRQHPDNPNNGDLEKLIESIKVNGFNTVCTIDAETGYLLAGNHRWQALHALGATHIPVIRAQPTDEGGTRYLLADNAVGQAAQMDKAMQVQLLKDLQDTPLGLFGTGVDDQELQDLMQAMLAEQHMPLAPGGFDQAPNGIYQVVVEFNNEDDRDELFAELADQYEDKVRTVNL